MKTKSAPLKKRLKALQSRNEWLHSLFEHREKIWSHQQDTIRLLSKELDKLRKELKAK
jgi:hypothetical protein